MEFDSRSLDRGLALLHSGHAAKAVWDCLGDELAEEQKRLDRELFKEMAQGVVITPERAIQFIHSKYAHFRLIQSLNQKLKAGERAGVELAPLMEAQNG